jgi:hypothetical protein
MRCSLFFHSVSSVKSPFYSLLSPFAQNASRSPFFHSLSQVSPLFISRSSPFAQNALLPLFHLLSSFARLFNRPSVYGRGLMYDLAWGLQNYEEANEEPEIYTIISGLGVGQLEADRIRRKQKQQSTLTLVQAKFGLKSPYGDSYK